MPGQGQEQLGAEPVDPAESAAAQAALEAAVAAADALEAAEKAPAPESDPAPAAEAPVEPEAPADEGEPEPEPKQDDDAGEREEDDRVAEPTAAEMALQARVTELEAQVDSESEEKVRRRLQRLAAAELPVESWREAMMHFRRPFSPAAVRWKLQTVFKNFSGGVVVAYIDARLVVERLNAVWPYWETPTFENAGNGALRCYLTMLDPSLLVNGAPLRITRSDVGLGSGPQALKGTNSDALKRAAVMFGVGVSVYAMRAITLNVGAGDAELRTQRKKIGQGTDRREVDYPVLDQRNEDRLALGYERWLAARGIPLFGPVLDHGDELGAGGIEEAPMTVGDGQERELVDVANAEAEAGDSPVLEDERAKQLIAELEAAYEQVRKTAPRKLAPAAFRAKLNSASRKSHQDLEELLETVQAIVQSANAS